MTTQVITTNELLNVSPDCKELFINCKDFNHPLNSLPFSLQKLIIYSKGFTQSLDDLPSSITTLELNCTYKGSLGKLPSSLETLIITDPLFNLSLSDLPASVTNLRIVSEDFQQPLEVLPSNLKNLYIEGNYNQEFTESMVAPALETITISSYWFSQAIDYVPPSLKKLHLDCASFMRTIKLNGDCKITIKSLYSNSVFAFILPPVSP